jgi:hypothetical protein
VILELRKPAASVGGRFSRRNGPQTDLRHLVAGPTMMSTMSTL